MVRELTRRTVARGGIALALGGMTVRYAQAAPGERKLAYAGVNIAGAEFGKMPGRYGFDYAYPSPGNIDYYAGLGFNLIRVPFRWERLQPKLNAELATDEYNRLAAVVGRARTKGLTIILDPHNYAHRRIEDDAWKTDHAIGTDAVPTSAFADFWERLAERHKSDPHVIFGLMNEPANISLDAWLPAANAAVASIRKAGASNLILVPGVAYTGAHSWISSGNVRMREIVDPANRFAFEVHQYLDADSSGTSPKAVSATIGSQRISEFQDWARENGVTAVLGEFGASDDATSLAALQDLCRTIEANPDVWLGWTAWAAGAWWPQDYMFNLEPTKDGHIRKQTQVLADSAQRIRNARAQEAHQ